MLCKETVSGLNTGKQFDTLYCNHNCESQTDRHTDDTASQPRSAAVTYHNMKPVILEKHYIPYHPVALDAFL